MRIALHDQLGCNIEAYIDDLVVKTQDQSTLLVDLADTFDSLRRMCMKLNPEKCVFGVPSGKLLGFLVSSRGIDVNPEKITPIDYMRPSTHLKDVQRLSGCMAALGRFISKLGEWGLPLFKLLKRLGLFKWTPEAEPYLPAGLGGAKTHGVAAAIHHGHSSDCECRPPGEMRRRNIRTLA